MADALIREQITQLLFKLQSDPTVDPSAGAADFLRSITGTEYSLNPEIDDSNEYHAGLGAGDFVVGTFLPQIPIVSNVRGSGVAATPWEVDALMAVCGWVVTAYTTTLPTGGPTTATSGTSDTVVVPVGSDWPATTALGTDPVTGVIGLPVILAGNPSTAEADVITDYSVTSGNATITLGRKVKADGTARTLSSATTIIRPICVAYRTGSPSPHPFGALYFELETLTKKFFGCRGSHTQTWTARKKAVNNFNLNGFYAGSVDRSPTASVVDDPTGAPIWAGGEFTLNRIRCCGQTLSFALNNEGAPHDCPTASEGWDEYVVSKRRAVVTLDPDMSLTQTRDAATQLKNGTIMSVVGILGKIVGGAAGERVSMCMPRGKMRSVVPGVRNGTRFERYELQSPDANRELIVCTF